MTRKEVIWKALLGLKDESVTPIKFPSDAEIIEGFASSRLPFDNGFMLTVSQDGKRVKKSFFVMPDRKLWADNSLWSQWVVDNNVLNA